MSQLDDWLTILEQRHPRAIDLGLHRVGAVWQAMAAPPPAHRTIIVAGTNGKGSTVAFIEAAARALGWRTGSYTSPHLLRYNERIRIDGEEASDEAIVAAFECIEAARGEITLTYFEFGTLAALWLMAQSSLDLAVLEVGLGGRLDAVNIMDADVAVVTTVDLDHQDWLGDTRAAIGVEKAGIARAGRPLLVGERMPEPALLESARVIGAHVLRLGQDFDCEIRFAGDQSDRFWRWQSAYTRLPASLPLPAQVQWDNAVTALTALASLSECAGLPFDADRAVVGLAATRLPGRLHHVAGSPDIWLDVGHNPQAAGLLADWLREHEDGKATDAVFAALTDKDVLGIVAPLRPWIRHWHLAGLDTVTPRGLTAQALAQRLEECLPPSVLHLHQDVGTALRAQRGPGRVLVFGSFHTVAQALQELDVGRG